MRKNFFRVVIGGERRNFFGGGRARPRSDCNRCAGIFVERKGNKNNPRPCGRGEVYLFN